MRPGSNTPKTADARQTEMLAAIEAAYKTYYESLAETMSMADQASATIPISAEQQSLLEQATKGHALGRKLEETVRAYTEYSDAKARQHSAQTSSTYTISALLIAIVAIGGILAGLMVSNRGVVQPIRSVVDCPQALASGDLAVTVFGVERRKRSVTRTLNRPRGLPQYHAPPQGDQSDTHRRSTNRRASAAANTRPRPIASIWPSAASWD